MSKPKHFLNDIKIEGNPESYIVITENFNIHTLINLLKKPNYSLPLFSVSVTSEKNPNPIFLP